MSLNLDREQSQGVANFCAASYLCMRILPIHVWAIPYAYTHTMGKLGYPICNST